MRALLEKLFIKSLAYMPKFLLLFFLKIHFWYNSRKSNKKTDSSSKVFTFKPQWFVDRDGNN